METQQRLFKHLPTPDKDFRQGSWMTHNLHVNGDSMASPDMSSGIISAVMEDDGSFTYNMDIVPDHVPKTTKCVQHTMTQHDSPAKVFAKLKSQLQRERHPLNDVASTSNLFPNEVVALKRDQDITNVVSGRRRLIKSQGECVSLERLPQSPAKLFDHIKERERNRLIQEGCKAERGKMMIQKRGECVSLERLPQSPAKLYDHIKERERNRLIQEGCKAERDKMMIQKRGMHAMELKTSMNDVRSVPEGADDQDVQPFVVDPILVNSPHIRMRTKRREDVHKVPTKPSEDTHQQVKVTGVYLTKWMLKSDVKGLYVDGIRQDNNLHWHSSSIVTRVSNTVLKTTSGKTYNLVGRMAMPMDSELPQCFLKKFADGFPEDWRMLYDKFTSESINLETDGKVVKRRSEKAVTNHSVKRQRWNVSSTYVSCTPTSSAKTVNVSRSGRVIKTPLDYWRGGRVIVGKDMNVTIYDSFNTTICLPQVEAEVSRSNCAEKTRSERKPPPRPRHRNVVGSKPAKQTGGHNEPLNTDLSIPEGFSRRSTSIAGITAMQPTLYTDGVPESEANSNHRSRQRSKSPKRRRQEKAIFQPDSNDGSRARPHSRRKGTKALRETGSKARKNVYKAPPN